MFGTYVRELRAKSRLGLREFCLKLDFDPSYWSKIERGVAQPPVDEETLSRIASVLEVNPNSKDWQKLNDLAHLSRGKIPSDLLTNSELLPLLPLVFRTIRGDKPTEEELETLAELIRNS